MFRKYVSYLSTILFCFGISISSSANEISAPCDVYLKSMCSSTDAPATKMERDNRHDINNLSVATKTNTKLKEKMIELKTKYPDEKSRLADPKKYFTDIKSLIALTKDGPRLLRCFEQFEGEPFLKDNLFELLPASAMEGFVGTFEVISVLGQPGKYQKAIQLSSAEEPLVALTTIMHEMQHSCRSKSRANDIDLEDGAAVTASYQDDLVDEIRSYKVGAAAFAELSAQLPEEFCKNTFEKAGLINRSGAVPEYKFHAEINEKIQQGTFYRDVVRVYTINRMYPSKFYFYGSNPEEKPVPGLIKKMTEAGFPIQQ